MPVPEIIEDDARYAEIAKEFALKFTTNVAKQLMDAGHIDAKADTVSDYENDLLFTVCFAGLAAFEDHGHFTTSEGEMVAHVAFAEKPLDAETIIWSQRRVNLHGSLEDELLLAAIAQAKKRVSQTERKA